jgi:hypothetical protein
MAGFPKSFPSKSLLLLLCIGMLPLRRLAPAQNPPPEQKAVPAEPAGQTSFGALKSLAGAWTGVVTTDPSNPDINGPIQITMRVASGGNALVHEIASGGMPEPSLIYLDGDRLTLIHYCDAGNRPRLVARKALDRKTVEFDFVDISGDPMPAYVNHLVFTIVDADHHTEDWTFMLPGNNLLHAHFDLKRASGNAPPPAGN